MTVAEAPPEVAEGVIQTIKKGETSSLEAVHGFITTVNETIPDVAGADGRKKVIESAFKMTEQLVGAWSDVARQLAKVSQDALSGAGKVVNDRHRRLLRTVPDGRPRPGGWSRAHFAQSE
jgi:hypothetical protein